MGGSVLDVLVGGSVLDGLLGGSVLHLMYLFNKYNKYSY